MYDILRAAIPAPAVELIKIDLNRGGWYEKEMQYLWSDI